MVGGAEERNDGKTGVLIEAVVFDGEKCFFDIRRQGREFDRGSVFVLVDLEKKLAVAVQDLGGQFLGTTGKGAGGGQAGKDLDIKVIAEGGNKNGDDDEASVGDGKTKGGFWPFWFG